MVSRNWRALRLPPPAVGDLVVVYDVNKGLVFEEVISVGGGGFSTPRYGRDWDQEGASWWRVDQAEDFRRHCPGQSLDRIRAAHEERSRAAVQHEEKYGWY